MVILLLYYILIQSTVYSAPNSTDLLANLQISIDEFRDELQHSICKGGLGVGGPKCDEDFYGMQEFIDSFEDRMNVGSINASKEFYDIVNALNEKILIRNKMLQNLSHSIISSCILYAEDLDDIELLDYDSLYFGGSNKNEARLPSDIVYNDIYQTNVSLSASSFWIPHNVKYKNAAFKFDAKITSLLDPLFIELYDEYCAVNEVLGRSEQACQMYFGSRTGMFRVYPGSENPKDDDIYKSYDCRLRPWYIAAASGDMDIVIVVDLSVSMKDKMNLVISAILSIFNTLSASSFVNIIGFNDKLQETCLTDRLFSATQDSFEYLQEWLLNVDFIVGYADFVLVLEASYELIGSHRSIYGSNCNTGILFITDSGKQQVDGDILSFISEKRSIADLGVDDVVIFTYTIGNSADKSLAHSIANITEGVHTHIQENEEFIADKMSSFYKYYAFERDSNDRLSVSKPYFDFGTGELMITLSMPFFLNNTFVGVFGIDVPLSILEDAIGDIPIGIKSYSFLMNDNGVLLLHPSIPKYDEFQLIFANDIEPIQFIESGIFESMLNGQYGYKETTISYQQSLGIIEYYGNIEVDTDVIYFYAPIGPYPSSLSFGVVVWNDNQYESPLISSFGLETVRPNICPDLQSIQNISELNANEMDECLSRFNLFHELDLLLQCNETTEWVDKAQILSIDTSKNSNYNYANIFSQYEFYNKKNISLEYSTYFVQSGLWESKSEALKGINPSCEELNNLERMTIPVELSPPSNSIPYGGFKYEFSSHCLVSIYVFSSLYNWWKPAFLKSDSKIVSMWFGSYQGIHFSYPGKKFSSTYNPLLRPWYQGAVAFPNYFVLPTPHIHATTGKLVTGTSTVIYAPNSSTQVIGVAGLDWEYSGFVEKWRAVMFDVCHDEYSFNQCYLISTSGYFLYYEDMEFDIKDDDISHKFLGDIEPTLMQSLIELGLFKKRKHFNIVDNTVSLSYLLDEEVFVESSFSTIFRTFNKNSGKYTIHHVNDTNLYIIFIYEYLQIAYPWDCPNNEYCKSVESPGCIKYDTNHNGIIDVNDECHVLDQSVCSASITNNNSNSNSFIINPDETKKCIGKTKSINQCLVEKLKTFNLCSLSDFNDFNDVCDAMLDTGLKGWEIAFIVIACIIVFRWLIGVPIYYWLYQNEKKLKFIKSKAKKKVQMASSYAQ